MTTLPGVRVPNYKLVRDRLDSARADLADAIDRRRAGDHRGAEGFDGCVREALWQALRELDRPRS